MHRKLLSVWKISFDCYFFLFKVKPSFPQTAIFSYNDPLFTPSTYVQYTLKGSLISLLLSFSIVYDMMYFLFLIWLLFFCYQVLVFSVKTSSASVSLNILNLSKSDHGTIDPSSHCIILKIVGFQVFTTELLAVFGHDVCLFVCFKGGVLCISTLPDKTKSVLQSSPWA